MGFKIQMFNHLTQKIIEFWDLVGVRYGPSSKSTTTENLSMCYTSRGIRSIGIANTELSGHGRQ